MVRGFFPGSRGAEYAHGRPHESCELRENKPKIKIDFHFGAHETAEDARKVKEKFAECDIFVPELFGHSELVRSLFNSLSEGNITPEQFEEFGVHKRFAEYGLEEAKMIYGSKKNIEFVDLDYEQVGEYVEHSNSADKYEHDAQQYFLENRINKAIRTMKIAVDKRKDATRKRESRIAKNLVALTSLAEKKWSGTTGNKPLKEEVKILVQLGAAHSEVYKAVKHGVLGNAGVAVKREFDEKGAYWFPHPFVASRLELSKHHTNSSLRKLLSADVRRRSEKEDELYLKILVEGVVIRLLVSNYFPNKTNLPGNGKKLRALMGHISESLSVDEVVSIPAYVERNYLSVANKYIDLFGDQLTLGMVRTLEEAIRNDLADQAVKGLLRNKFGVHISEATEQEFANLCSKVESFKKPRLKIK